MPKYRVLLTRDMTESAVAFVEAEDRDEAVDLAKRTVEERHWTLDDCNHRDSGDFYLGDPEHAVEEVPVEEYEAGIRGMRELTEEEAGRIDALASDSRLGGLADAAAGSLGIDRAMIAIRIGGAVRDAMRKLLIEECGLPEAASDRIPGM